MMTRDVSPTSLQNEGGEEHRNGAEETESKTFLNSLLSTIIPEKAPPATTADGADCGQEGGDGGRKDGVENGDGGGIIGHLISNLVSPGSPKAGQSSGKRKAEVLDVEDTGRVGGTDGVSRAKRDGESGAAGGGGGGGGGVISSLISSFFHSSEEGGATAAARGDETERHREAERDEKKAATSELEERSGGGGGVIQKIVSHLPPSLPEDTGPTADEASILIHSIVRD